jgi:hypothetical protein
LKKSIDLLWEISDIGMHFFQIGSSKSSRFQSFLTYLSHHSIDDEKEYTEVEQF